MGKDLVEDSSVVWFALISKRNILADTPSDDTQRMFMGNSSPVCKFVDAPRTGRIGTGKLITQELGTKKLGNWETWNWETRHLFASLLMLRELG